jgi:hypothetical protein
MYISPHWTETERLEVIALLASHLRDLASQRPCVSSRQAGPLADMIQQLADRSSALLELNRQTILRTVEEMPHATT